MLTFVTGFHPVRKDVTGYFQSFDTFARSGVPILLFLDTSCEVQNYPNVKVIRSTHDTSWIPTDAILPAVRNEPKDTAEYLSVILQKLKYMSEAVKYVTTPYLAWIDFGIFHVIKHPELAQEKLRALSTRSFSGLAKIIAPGCWSPDPKFDFLNSICWRYSGGVLLGPRNIFPLAYARQTELVTQHLPRLTWEVNYWSQMEEFFQWCYGAHDDSILMNIPYSPRILRLGHAPHYVDGGKFRRVHVGGAVEQTIFQALCESTEDGILVMPKTDMLVESAEHQRMRQSVSWNDPAISDANALHMPEKGMLCVDTSRKIPLDNILHYPLDDDTLWSGLPVADLPRWETRQDCVIWRGGTSGVERPTARMRVVRMLLKVPHADVKFTRGGWPQNDAEISDDEFGNRISMQEHSAYKYMLCIDGNGAASSAQWIFASGCVPLFVTHPDTHFWLKEFLIPMVNYVPIEYDLSNLTEKIQWLVDHDAEAKQIAENALRFSTTVLNPSFQKQYIKRRVCEIVTFTRTNAQPNMDPEYMEPAGRQHYRFLEEMASKVSYSTLFDIGTHKGMSACALSTNPTNRVMSFDIVTKPGLPVLPNVEYHTDDLMTTEGREKWKAELLVSPFIFLDIDPHEGTREYEFYEWLRDQDYKGFLICDHIWQFKEMRDNFWYKIRSEHKIDMTERGHSSGTGIIRFHPSELCPAKVPPSNWTVVTAYFDLTRMVDASPSIKSRPARHYLASAVSTLSLDQNMVIFCEPGMLSTLRSRRPDHLQEKTLYIPLSFEDLPLTKYRSQIIENRKMRPSADDRNTASYYLLCMARYAMLKQVIDKNPFGSTHFAWLNICIERMGWKNLTQLDRVFEINRDKFSTCYIDYQRKVNYLDDVMRWGRCSMCSGFFTGNAHYMKTFCDRIEQKFLDCLERGYGHADEQLYSLVYFDDPSIFEVYYGDYTEMVTNYEWIREHSSKPLHYLIKHSYDAGDKETCLKGCIALWRSWKKRYAKLSEQDVTHLIWYYERCLPPLRELE